MARRASTGLLSQYAKNAGGASASGYWLKFYGATYGASTSPKSMYTEQVGGAVLDKCMLNTRGEPINNVSDDDSTFIPYVEGDYDAYIFFTESDADSNNTINSIFLGTNIQEDFYTPLEGAIGLQFSTVEDLVAGESINVDGIFGAIDFSRYEGQDVTTVVNNATSKAGGAPYTIKTTAQAAIDGDVIDGTGAPNYYGGNHALDGGTHVAVLVQDGTAVLTQYGTRNDGTDDSEPYQLAINYADSKAGVVFHPKATYLLSQQISMYSCSLKGESQRGVAITCGFPGIQFLLSETWQYAECKNLRFTGDGSNICFSANNSGAGFFGLEFESLRFTGFNKAFEVHHSLFNNFRNVQFRTSDHGVYFDGSSGTYHNQNYFGIGTYFDVCSISGIHFDSASNGSSLLIDGTSFDHCEIGLDAYRPCEIALYYHERNEIGIRVTNSNVQIGRGYWLGESSGPATAKGIEADNSTIIQTGQWNMVDNFGPAIDLANGSTLINMSRAEWTGSGLISIDGTSSQIVYKDTIEKATLSVSAAPEITEITNLSTTPEDVGSGRFDKSCQYTCKVMNVDSDSSSFSFGLKLDADAGSWRVEAFNSTTNSITRIDQNEFEFANMGDGLTYTFTVNAVSGQMQVESSGATVGDTVITVQGQDNIPL